MTEIERKALALVNEVRAERGQDVWRDVGDRKGYGIVLETLCRAIEQHEAFKQEVSDAVEEWHGRWVGAGESHSYFMSLFSRFIIAKPVDPLVEVMRDALSGMAGTYTYEELTPAIRAALAARGLEIRSKTDG